MKISNLELLALRTLKDKNIGEINLRYSDESPSTLEEGVIYSTISAMDVKVLESSHTLVRGAVIACLSSQHLRSMNQSLSRRNYKKEELIPVYVYSGTLNTNNGIIMLEDEIILLDVSSNERRFVELTELELDGAPLFESNKFKPEELGYFSLMTKLDDYDV